MNLARVRAIAFDLDGTLVDSRLDLAEAVNRARGDVGLGPLAVDAILGMVGEGARRLVSRALGGDPEPELFERAFAAFYRHYDAVCCDRTVPFPGVDELVRGVANRVPLAVLTNKPERFARRIVEHLGWAELLPIVVGGDTFASRKPDPEGLRAVAARLAVAADQLLLVGDSRVDADTAHAAGAPFVLVEWGFARDGERRELAAAPAIARPADLLDLLS